MKTYNTQEKEALLRMLSEEYLPAQAGNKSRAAAELGMSHKVLNGLLAGNYAGNEHAQLAKLEEGLRIWKQQAATPAGSSREFVHTQLAGRVWAALDAARSASLINTIVGPPQIGKTTAAAAYKRRYPESTILLRLPKRPTMTTTVQLLLEAMGMPGRWRGTFEARCRIAAKLTPRHLLVVDEAHLALETPQGADCLDMIREFWDRAGCGVALMLTDYDHGRKLTKSQWAGMLSQLIERGFWEVLPDMPTGGDVAAIWQAYGLPQPDEGTARAITAIVKRWKFGKLSRALGFAYAEATRGGREISWADFNAALSRLGHSPE